MKENLVSDLAFDRDNIDWGYFVEWKPRLWTPAVRWVLGDTARFAGRKVLELGCRNGRMSCLFGLLGAQVQGVDLDGVCLDTAHAEIENWQLGNRVSVCTYTGDPADIPGDDYDFIFTKSVLVVVPNLAVFLDSLATKLRPGGEVLAAENLQGGVWLQFFRRFILHRDWKNIDREFVGIDDSFHTMLGEKMQLSSYRAFYGLVAAMRLGQVDHL